MAGLVFLAFASFATFYFSGSLWDNSGISEQDYRGGVTFSTNSEITSTSRHFESQYIDKIYTFGFEVQYEDTFTGGSNSRITNYYKFTFDTQEKEFYLHYNYADINYNYYIYNLNITSYNYHNGAYAFGESHDFGDVYFTSGGNISDYYFTAVYGQNADFIWSFTHYKITFDFALFPTNVFTFANDNYESNEQLINDNYNIGYSYGYDAGYDAYSSSEEYQTAIDDSYDLGWDNGHASGYNEGIGTQTYTFMNLFGAIADTPIMIMRNLLGFDVFGVDAMSIVMSMLTGCIVIYLIKRIIL